jgi:secreted trypsin-like serine protease
VQEEETMRRKHWMVLVALAVTLILATPASAVIWGEPDGDAHPYVGMVRFYDDDDNVWRCSGTLIAPRVLLTAGHCTSGAQSAQVWFGSDLSGLPDTYAGGYRGTPHTHPNYDDFATFPNTSDVGVVVLDKPVRMKTYGQLPKIGQVNRYHVPQQFTIVGYGVQETVPNPNVQQADLMRYRGNPMLVELNSANTGGFNIHLGSNPGEGNGQGGACLGDSGGPAFVPGSDTVVGGVSSWSLNQNCVGGSFYYRMDTEHAQKFVNSFLKKKP